MTELVRIHMENAEQFAPFLTEEAFLYLAYRNAVGFGLLQDDTPAGALVLHLEGSGAARLLSVRIDEPHRRQGLGTELMCAAAYFLDTLGGVERITADEARSLEREDALYLFLKSFDATFEEKDSGCFVTTLGAARKQKALQEKNHQEGIVPYRKLKAKEKKLLSEEEVDVSPLAAAGRLEEDISCVICKNGVIDSCLLFEKEEDAVSVAWARTSQANPAQIILLFRYALEQAKRYDDAYPLFIPVLNAESAKLVQKLLGKDAKRIEAGYHAEIALAEP